MSEKNSNKEKSAKSENKEQGYNLVQTLMDNLNMKDKNQPMDSRGQLNSENKPKDNINFNIMNDMIKKIDKHDYNALKELLDTQNISKKSKNKLLNLSFTQLYLTNNNNQKQIILELIKHGADPNYKLQFDISDKKKLNNYSISKDIVITPLIYCCIKGDYDFFELIKDKVNLSTTEKNYLFYFFENKQNFDNKYKIANSILQKSKEDNSIKININDFDRKSGMTLLMLSVINKLPNFIKLLLDNGADINLKNLTYGDTALHYAAQIKVKEIIELLIKDKNCDCLKKNSKNETIIDIATKGANTEIYSLLAKKYSEQQKIYEEKLGKENNKVNKVEKPNGNNTNGNKENNNKKNENAKDILKSNQTKKNIQDFNSYIEIPFQFTNNSFNYVDYYDSNIKNNKVQNGINEVEINNDSFKDENDVGNIKNYLKFKGAPVLNINLKI